MSMTMNMLIEQSSGAVGGAMGGKPAKKKAAAGASDSGDANAGEGVQDARGGPGDVAWPWHVNVAAQDGEASGVGRNGEVVGRQVEGGGGDGDGGERLKTQLAQFMQLVGSLVTQMEVREV